MLTAGKPVPGTKIKCPKCNAHFRVPRDDDSSDDRHEIPPPRRPKAGREREPERKPQTVAIVLALFAMLGVVGIIILAVLGVFSSKPAPIVVHKVEASPPRPAVGVDLQPHINPMQRPFQPAIEVLPRPRIARLEHNALPPDEDRPPRFIPIVREQSGILRGHEDRMSLLAVPHRGRILASTGHDKIVRLWDLDELKERERCFDFEGSLGDLIFSPDGQFLAARAHRRLILWDRKTRKIKNLEGFANEVTAFNFSPDSKTIVGACTELADGTGTKGMIHMLFWDVQSGEVRLHLEGGKGRPIGVAFVDNGKRIMAATVEGEVTLWRIDRRQVEQSLKAPTKGELSRLLVSSGGRCLGAVLGYDVKLWDPLTGEESSTAFGHRYVSRQIALNRDGSRLVGVVFDFYEDYRHEGFDEAWLWDLTDRLPLAAFRGPRGSMNSIALSADDKTLITGGVDGLIRLWDLTATLDRTRTPIRKIEVTVEATEKAAAFIAKKGGKFRRQGREIVVIDLSGANVSDADLDELLSLKWLRDLRLDKNPITKAGLERLKGFTQLEELSIRETPITEAEAAAFRTAMPECWITWSADRLVNAMINEHYQWPAAVNALGGSVKRDAAGDIVEVRVPRVTDEALKILGDLAQLRVLNILGGEPESRLKITDEGLTHLSRLTQLEAIDINWSNITDAGVARLAQFQELKSLWLNGTKITNEGIKYLKRLRNLRQLGLQKTAISDACVESLKEIRTLEYLQIEGNGISVAAGKALRQHLPRCMILHPQSYK